MLTVVFGAGASHDSINPHLSPVDDASRPPLASALFGHRADFGTVIDTFPSCRGIVGRLRSTFLRKPDAYLEDELEVLQAKAETYPPLRQDLAALRFYLQRSIWQCSERWAANANRITNYTLLINELAEWSASASEPLCFITFNYDTLLEGAVRDSSLGLRLPTIDSLVEDEGARILKLHGSVNWARRIHPKEGGWPQQEGPAAPYGGPHAVVKRAWTTIRNIDTFDLTDDFRLLSDVDQFWEDDTWLIPAIAIPVLKKKSFDECPPGHLKELDSVIRSTRRLLLIGWNGTEHHFLERWKTRNPFFPTQVVAGSEESAHGVAANIKAGGLETDRVLLSDKGFSEFVRAGEVEQLLQTKLPLHEN